VARVAIPNPGIASCNRADKADVRRDKYVRQLARTARYLDIAEKCWTNRDRSITRLSSSGSSLWRSRALAELELALRYWRSETFPNVRDDLVRGLVFNSAAAISRLSIPRGYLSSDRTFDFGADTPVSIARQYRRKIVSAGRITLAPIIAAEHRPRNGTRVFPGRRSLFFFPFFFFFLFPPIS